MHSQTKLFENTSYEKQIKKRKVIQQILAYWKGIKIENKLSLINDIFILKKKVYSTCGDLIMGRHWCSEENHFPVWVTSLQVAHIRSAEDSEAAGCGIFFLYRLKTDKHYVSQKYVLQLNRIWHQVSSVIVIFPNILKTVPVQLLRIWGFLAFLAIPNTKREHLIS